MGHKLNDIWKEKEGSKVVWKLQAPNGILTFMTKTKATNFQKMITDKSKVRVEVDVIRKTTFEFVVEAVLDLDGDIDVEKTKEKVYEAYCKAEEDNTLHNHFSDEDLSYELGDEITDEN